MSLSHNTLPISGNLKMFTLGAMSKMIVKKDTYARSPQSKFHLEKKHRSHNPETKQFQNCINKFYKIYMLIYLYDLHSNFTRISKPTIIWKVYPYYYQYIICFKIKFKNIKYQLSISNVRNRTRSKYLFQN